LLWPEANAVAVIAGGHFYLIDGDDPNLYSTFGRRCIVNGMMLDEHRQILVVVADYRAHAFDVRRRPLWVKGPGSCINRIVSFAGTVMTVEIEDETGRLSETAEISTAEESVDDRRYLDRLVKILGTHPEVERFDPGLSLVEIQALERRFKFMFPPDLKGLLKFVVPIGKHFPNWRGDPDELQKRLDLPFEGIWFDVEHNGFRLPEWGATPSDPQARREIVRQAILDAPRLFPIFSHRYIPAEPNKSGNPVFSVHQTDIIHYGNDLANYFHREFQVPLPVWAAREPRPIWFWDDALGW
jgi:hypothetical protein